MEIKTTLGSSRTILDVYSPVSTTQLKTEFKDKVYPFKKVSIISAGKNWGYGCHAPNSHDSLLVDLRKCNKILDFDDVHGLVTLEPGVTFGLLADFLEKNGGNWITPVIGGGPECSVIGNALERGYGITPKTDHFGAITCLEAILKNGEIYRGGLTQLGHERLDKIFKYGIGPYFDGIFSQSGVGIVTQATISLAPKPNFVEAFYFFCKNEDDLKDIIEISRSIKKDLGDVVGGINILNRERVLSMTIDYPHAKKLSGEKLSLQEIDTYSSYYQVTPWLIFGALYGEKSIVKAAKKTIQKRFKRIKKRSLFYNSDNRSWFLKLQKVLSFFGKEDLKTSLSMMDKGFKVLLGTPNTIALKLAYWMHPNENLKNNEDLDPNRDGCGIIWYSPLVEFSPDKVNLFVKFMQNSAEKFGVNCLITLTTIDAKCFDSTIPILFNLSSPEQVERANAYYEYLLEEGSKLGFFPYRLTIDAQKKYRLNNNLFNIQLINEDRYV